MNEKLIVVKIWTAKHEGQAVVAYLNPNTSQLQWAIFGNVFHIPRVYLRTPKPIIEDWMEEGSLKQMLLTVSLSELSDITNEETIQGVECLET